MAHDVRKGHVYDEFNKCLVNLHYVSSEFVSVTDNFLFKYSPC